MILIFMSSHWFYSAITMNELLFALTHLPLPQGTILNITATHLFLSFIPLSAKQVIKSSSLYLLSTLFLLSHYIWSLHWIWMSLHSLSWVFFSGILIASISFLELLWPVLVVLFSGSTVPHSFGGVFWSGHKPGQSSLGSNNIKEPQNLLLYYSFIFVNGFRWHSGLWCSQPSFPFILLFYNRLVEKMR